MTDHRRYSVKKWAEDYRHERVHRREFLRRLASLAGGAALGVAGLEWRASAAAGTSRPASSTSIDSNNNLLVNGEPFLPIKGTTVDYTSWYVAGYSESEADAKYRQMIASGFNCISGGHEGVLATRDGTPYFAPPYSSTTQDMVAWQKFGIYSTLDAARDDLGQCNPADPSNDACIGPIVARTKDRPNLLLWTLYGETNPADYPRYSMPDPQSYANQYRQVARTVRNADPAHPVVHSWAVTSWALELVWDQLVNSQGLQIPMVELVLPRSSSIDALEKLYHWLSLMNKRVLANPNGLGWIPSISTTPVSELLGTTPSNLNRIASQAEIYRYFMMQVAFNCRAFEILWGPNIRSGPYYPNNGDAGLPPGYLDVWNWSWQAMSRVKALEPVILASGIWTQTPTTPAFVPPNPYTGASQGIYAAKKTVSGATYVIAINTNEQAKTPTELPVRGAKIEVGRKILGAKYLFAPVGAGPSINRPVSFSGSVINDDFEPMQVLFYKIE